MQINTITSLSNNTQLKSNKISNNFAKSNLISKTECDSVEIKNNSNNINFNGKAGGIFKMLGGSTVLLSGLAAGTPIIGTIAAALIGGILTTVGCHETVNAICKESEKEKNIESFDQN